jgi:hypothetical protein
LGEVSGDWDWDEDGDGGEEGGTKDSEGRRRPCDDIVYGSDSGSDSTSSSSSSASVSSSIDIENGTSSRGTNRDGVVMVGVRGVLGGGRRADENRRVCGWEGRFCGR